MSPFDAISRRELTAIEDYIKRSINSESYEPFCGDLRYLLREWNDKKSFLFDVFNQRLIISKNVCFVKDDEQIKEEINRAMEEYIPEPASNFIRKFHHFCFDKRYAIHAKRHDEIEFLPEEDDDELIFYSAEQLISSIALAKNEVTTSFDIKLPKPDGTFRVYKVPLGARPIKVLKKINRAFHITPDEELDSLATWQSKYLNDRKIKGELCLSIHPLDYMTMSDNNCDWTSCMSWANEGCYRGGTVEMMNSPMVLVAYIKSANNPLQLNCGTDPFTGECLNLEWNSKKWRILICVNAYGIFSVKGYPYQHEELTKCAIEWISSLLTKRTFQSIRSFRAFHNIKLTPGEDSSNYLRINPRTIRMYNDFGSTTHYMKLDSNFVKRAVKDDSLFTTNIDFCYSGASECMNCGTLSYGDSVDQTFSEANQLCCDECNHVESDFTRCDICGERVYEDDCYWVHGTPVCSECFEETCFIDALTEEYNFNETGMLLYIRTSEKVVKIGKCARSTILDSLNYAKMKQNNVLKSIKVFYEKYPSFWRKKYIILEEDDFRDHFRADIAWIIDHTS